MVGENPQRALQSPSRETSEQPSTRENKQEEPGHSDCRFRKNRATLSRSHSESSNVSLPFALVHLVSRVFPETALCGDALPLGCQGDPSNSNTSAELAGTGLWNISETQRQKGQTNNPSHPHTLPPALTPPLQSQNTFLNRR